MARGSSRSTLANHLANEWIKIEMIKVDEPFWTFSIDLKYLLPGICARTIGNGKRDESKINSKMFGKHRTYGFERLCVLELVLCLSVSMRASDVTWRNDVARKTGEPFT